MREDTVDCSDEALEAMPERVTRFLAGLGALPTVRTLLFEAGMADEEIVEGRTLLLAVLAGPRSPAMAADTVGARAQRVAVAELDEWDEPNFTRFGAALRRHFPDQAAYVFRDLGVSQGVEAVKGVATLLARLDALEKGTDEQRFGSRKEDQRAIELLARRGLDRRERIRLKELVGIALGPTAPLPAPPSALSKEARREALIELRKWYDEWSSAARAVVKKRSNLIRLGLASRRPPRPRDEPGKPE
ncbi:MAG: hypothetical protein IT372_14705 [Polyangiaceae bacterium]|nr:hypothetical protein [Polyangiaceae bacterium]